MDLLTGIILNGNGRDGQSLLSVAKRSCHGLVILESATAERELPAIGVHKGDQYLRMWIRAGHDLNAGEEVSLGDDS
jgi:hypothetical protein